MDSYFVYIFLGVFLGLSLLCYGNLLIVQFFGLRFGWNDKQAENAMQALQVLSLSFLWYAISLSFTLYNKWLLQQWHTGFHFPIIITTIHMIMKYFITRVWALTPEAENVPNVPWKVLSSVVIPIGVCTSADIVFANIAIYFLPLSMYTTIKGGTLVFTFCLGVLCGVEVFRWPLFFAVLGLAGGLGLAVAESTEALSAVGLLCVMLSSGASAIRWVLMQVLALQDEHSGSVMVTLYRFSPYSAISIIPFALTLETRSLVHSSFADTPTLLVQALLYCVFGGVVSFLLIIAEVKLLRVTSSLTMCVIGQIKEIIQIGAAMVLFKDHISMRSGLGILLSILAAYWYRVLKADNGAEGEGSMDERAATLQILQSSELAHRGVRGLGLLGNGTTADSSRSTSSGKGGGGHRIGNEGYRRAGYSRSGAEGRLRDEEDQEEDWVEEGESLLRDREGSTLPSSPDRASSSGNSSSRERRDGASARIRDVEMTQMGVS
jgi:hypothetical protein